ncbi:MAG: hypothetical protein R6U01_11275 [Halorubrum sp.]|uniref:hypothetical protein n=1 Tax=Halorubrum sp. TaxID=1879286 RepID=UPI003970A121
MSRHRSSIFDVSFIDQQQVVSEWLAEEQSKPSAPKFDIETDDQRHEVEAKILAHKPGVARNLLSLNLSWIRCRLSERALRDVYTIWGDPEERDTVEAAVNRIRAGGSSPHPSSLDRITGLAENAPDDWGTLIIVHHHHSWRRGTPALIDGNHRATAAILRAEEQGQYEPRQAYVGYSGPSKVSDIRRWLHASLRTL